MSRLRTRHSHKLSFEQYERRLLPTVSVAEVAHLLSSDLAAEDNFGKVVSVWEDTVLVGAKQHDEAGTDAGAAYIFSLRDGVWQETAKLMSDDIAAGDEFGRSVSIHENTAVVGAYYDDDRGSRSGSAYVFVRNGDTWTQQAKLIADEADTDGLFNDDFFGISVALWQDTIVVGSRLDDDVAFQAGAAYVFARSGESWNFQAKLTAEDGGVEDFFGSSVSIHEDTVIVGAQQCAANWCVLDDRPNIGAAYVYARDGETWTQQAKLMPGDAADADAFGRSVSVWEDRVVVGSFHDDDNGSASGSAYVFARDGTTWTQQQKLTASDGAPTARFGHAVAIHGDSVLIGAFADDRDGLNGLEDDSGAAYLFQREGSVWKEQAKLTASDAAQGDVFGFGVALSDDFAVIGAEFDSTNAGVRSGSAYVFDVKAKPADVPGDANQNGVVNFDDFLLLSSQFGAMGPNLAADFNSDETVDFQDFLILATNFGQTA